jgi:hypothetical protein
VESQHQCLRLDIADWELPEDPVDAIALASDDVWLSNNWAQQNVFDFVALGGSPYAPIRFLFSVTNDGVSPERAYLEPEGLAPGMKLTVTPRIVTLQPKQTFVFRCLLELDEQVIDTGCRNDRAFLLWAWRETTQAFERWGGCKYVVRPRKGVMVELSGWWSFDLRIPISGAVVPDPGPGSVLVRVAFDGGERSWRRVPLQAGGTFVLELDAGNHEGVELVAHFEGSADFGPAYSEILVLARSKSVG